MLSFRKQKAIQELCCQKNVFQKFLKSQFRSIFLKIWVFRTFVHVIHELGVIFCALSESYSGHFLHRRFHEKKALNTFTTNELLKSVALTYTVWIQNWLVIENARF